MRKIGVLLPNGLAPVDGARVLEWARRADAGPFSTVAMTDRLTYRNLEPMVTLAAALGATSRVRIASTIVLGPLRSAPILAKQVATLATLADGRFTLGIGVGGRKTDYDAAGVPWKDRDRILDSQLEYLERLRNPASEQDIGPKLDGLEILIGGAREAALRRLVRYGDGYVSGGIKPQLFGYDVQAVRGAWKEAGKPGEPRIVGSTWYASSAREGDEVDRNLAAYFAQGGPPEFIRDTPMRGRSKIIEGTLELFELGADEVLLYPCVSDVSELEFLAELVPEIQAA